MGSDIVRDLRVGLADFLKHTRLVHKMSHEDLALIVNGTPEQIEAYENAAATINAIDLFIIAKSLHIPLENFFFHHNQDEPLEEGQIEQQAYAFLKAFSAIEDPELRKKILEMCQLYEEFNRNPIC